MLNMIDMKLLDKYPKVYNVYCILVRSLVMVLF